MAQPSVRMKFAIRDSAYMFTSDQVLRFQGFLELVKIIKSYKGTCRIAIVGGQHSAFSVLYLLLYGPNRIKLFEDIKQCKYKSQNSKKAQSMLFSPQGKLGKKQDPDLAVS